MLNFFRPISLLFTDFKGERKETHLPSKLIVSITFPYGNSIQISMYKKRSFTLCR